MDDVNLTCFLRGLEHLLRAIDVPQVIIAIQYPSVRDYLRHHLGSQPVGAPDGRADRPAAELSLVEVIPAGPDESKVVDRVFAFRSEPVQPQTLTVLPSTG